MTSTFRPAPRSLPPPPPGEYDVGFANLYLRTDNLPDSGGDVCVFVTLTIDGPESSFTVRSLLPIPNSIFVIHSYIAAIAAAAHHGPR